MDMIESILSRIAENQTEAISSICRRFGVGRGSQKWPIRGYLSISADPLNPSKTRDAN